MKKRVLGFLIMLFVFALLTKSNVFAGEDGYDVDSTCPPGYDFISFYFTDSYTGCRYFIGICYSCTALGTTNVNYKINDLIQCSTTPACSFSVPHPDTVANAIFREIALQDLCPLPPPCDKDTLLRTIKMPVCGYFFNDTTTIYWQGKLIDTNITRLYTCDSVDQGAFCVRTYEVCTDFSVIPPVVKTTFVSSIKYNEPGCYPGPPLLPPIKPGGGQYGWDEEWRTHCFEVPEWDCEGK
jgi:hypothetical protein